MSFEPQTPENVEFDPSAGQEPPGGPSAPRGGANPPAAPQIDPYIMQRALQMGIAPDEAQALGPALSTTLAALERRLAAQSPPQGQPQTQWWEPKISEEVEPSISGAISEMNKFYRERMEAQQRAIQAAHAALSRREALEETRAERAWLKSKGEEVSAEVFGGSGINSPQFKALREMAQNIYRAKAAAGDTPEIEDALEQAFTIQHPDKARFIKEKQAAGKVSKWQAGNMVGRTGVNGPSRFTPGGAPKPNSVEELQAKMAAWEAQHAQ